jgi:hypothetical protein
MSGEAGDVQRTLIAAFQGERGRRVLVEELAEIAFPGERSSASAWSGAPGVEESAEPYVRFSQCGQSGTRGRRYLVA